MKYCIYCVFLFLSIPVLTGCNFPDYQEDCPSDQAPYLAGITGQWSFNIVRYHYYAGLTPVNGGWHYVENEDSSHYNAISGSVEQLESNYFDLCAPYTINQLKITIPGFLTVASPPINLGSNNQFLDVYSDSDLDGVESKTIYNLSNNSFRLEWSTGTDGVITDVTSFRIDAYR